MAPLRLIPPETLDRGLRVGVRAAKILLAFILVLSLAISNSFLPGVHALSVATIFIDPVRTPGPSFHQSGPPSNFSINVMLDLPAGAMINVFDVRLNYTSPLSTLKAVGVDYSGNVFSAQGGKPLVECIDGTLVQGSDCPGETFGQVHLTEWIIGAGNVVAGPLTGGLLFSVEFSIRGNGTSVFSIDNALLGDPGSGPQLNPHFVPYVAQAGVFGNYGVVAFFNFDPPTPPSVLLRDNVTFDGSGSFDANNPSVPIVSYAWDFGDGGTGQGVAASHVFNLPGNYSVRLTVQAQGGGSGIVVRVVNVVPALGGLEVFVKDNVVGSPIGGTQVIIQIFNSTTSRIPFKVGIPDFTGEFVFRGLRPGSYFLIVNGTSFVEQSKMENIVAGWTVQDTVYLQRVTPPSRPPDYSGIIFVGSMLGGLGIFATAIVLKRRSSNNRRGDQKRSVGRPKFARTKWRGEASSRFLRNRQTGASPGILSCGAAGRIPAR